MSGLSYVYIFFQSNFLEVPVYILFYVFIFKSSLNIKQTSIVVTLTNLLTHPLVFFVIMRLSLSYIENILIAEAFAIGAETLLHAWIFRISAKKTFVASLFANLVSWQLAPMLTFYIFY